MIKRRGVPRRLAHSISPAATGYLRLVSALSKSGGTLELAQQIAAHESAATAKLHNRTRGPGLGRGSRTQQNLKWSITFSRSLPESKNDI
jgi:hypothetical protein